MQLSLTSVGLCLLTTLPVAAPWAHAVDADYETLAAAITSPIFNSYEESMDGFADGKVIYRLELARQTLETLKASDPAVAALCTKALDPLEECDASLKRLRVYDATVPDYSGIADAAIHAAPGLVRKDDSGNLLPDDQQAKNALERKVVWEIGKAIYNSVEASEERDAYHKDYEQGRASVHQPLFDLAKVQYANVGTLASADDKSAIGISMQGSLSATYSSDDVYLVNNSGKDLTRCTISVSLDGDSSAGVANSDWHMHYVKSWPAGATLVAHYPSKTAVGIATDESVDRIHKVSLALFTEQGTADETYDYSKEDYEKQLQDNYKNRLNPSFTGKYYPSEQNMVEDSSFEVTMNGGISRFPVSRVTVTLHEGANTIARYWDIEKGTWDAGELKHFEAKDFDGWHPDKVDVTLEFPDAPNSSQTLNWNLTN